MLTLLSTGITFGWNLLRRCPSQSLRRPAGLGPNQSCTSAQHAQRKARALLKQKLKKIETQWEPPSARPWKKCKALDGTVSAYFQRRSAAPFAVWGECDARACVRHRRLVAWCKAIGSLGVGHLQWEGVLVKKSAPSSQSINFLRPVNNRGK
jgi:hypothetical protein